MTGAQILVIVVSLVVAGLGAYEVVVCREEDRRRGDK